MADDTETPSPNGTYQRVGNSSQRDHAAWDRLEELVARHGRTPAQILDSFPLYARRVNLTRFIGHYELYRRVADLPGNFVECGVFRGAGLLSWAKFLEIFHPGDRSRTVVGFDNFAGFADLHDADGPSDPAKGKLVGGWSPAGFREELLDLVQLFQDDSFLPHVPRIELVECDIRDTAPDYARRNPGLRISLLHIDLDLYEPTLAALRAFHPLVVSGGLVVLDDFGIGVWPGASKALEDFFEGRPPRLEKLPFASTPGAFFVKP